MRIALSVMASLLLAFLLCVRGPGDPVQHHIIGPDDVLDISVTNHEELNKTVTVLEDGTITIPEVGTIIASGKTQIQLAAEIKSSLEKTRKLVSVYVAVKENRSVSVRVLGAVKIPGPYELKPDWRVMDLVDVGGGLSQKINHVAARVVRNRSQIIPIDLQKADSNRQSEFNVPLERDDLLIVDEIEVGRPQVIVLGAVNRSGVYDIDDQSTVLSVLTQAGGPTEKASVSTAYVTRAGTQYPLNLTKTLQAQSDPVVSAFKFKPGDVLFIPESVNHYSVMGAVGRQGFYPMPETGQITVVDALNLAGGSVGGSISKAGVIRDVNGKPSVIKVDIDKMLKKGDMANNIPLQIGDVLYIPANSNRQFNWMNVLGPLTALGLLGLHL